MNHIKLLFFATIRDRAGVRSLEMDVPMNMTVLDLKERLSKDYPTLAESLKSVLISINQEYSFDDAVIPLNAEIGMFPPVSGGSTTAAFRVRPVSLSSSDSLLLTENVWSGVVPAGSHWYSQMMRWALTGFSALAANLP